MDTLRLEDISDDIYFSEKFSEYISNSRLKLIDPTEGGTPAKFFSGLSANKIYSDSLVFGSALHELVLQNEEFVVVDSVNRPTAKAGAIADITYKHSYLGDMPSDHYLLNAAAEVDYYSGILTENQLVKLKEKLSDYMLSRYIYEKDRSDTRIPIYLDGKSREKLESCMQSLNSNPFINSLLNPVGLINDPVTGYEKTILLDVQVETPDLDPFVLRLKSKLDDFTLDFDSNEVIVNDLKTTGKRADAFESAVMSFRYYRELAMYGYLLMLCAKKFYGFKSPTLKGNFLVVSTIPNYNTRVVPMTKKLFIRGFEEFKHLLKLVAYYKAYGYDDVPGLKVLS